MGKRSDFIRRPNDSYMTPLEAVIPLAPFLPKNFTYAEPCAGDGRLIRHITTATNAGGVCKFWSDIAPLDPLIAEKDALDISASDLKDCDLVITNPPWDRSAASGKLLHKLIEKFSNMKPTWFLFDSDWVHTAQATPFLPNLYATVSIGRVKWIEGSKMSGKDNCSWHLFWKNAHIYSPAPMFFGRNYKPNLMFDKIYD